MWRLQGDPLVVAAATTARCVHATEDAIAELQQQQQQHYTVSSSVDEPETAGAADADCEESLTTKIIETLPRRLRYGPNTKPETRTGSVSVSPHVTSSRVAAGF